MLFDNNNLIYIGFVQKSFGLNGQIKISIIEKFINVFFVEKDLSVFFDMQGIPIPFFVEKIQQNGNTAILKLKYINSLIEADKYRNCDIYVEENFFKNNKLSEIPNKKQEDDFFNYEVYDSIIGFIGKVERLNNIPGNPVIEINFNEKIIMLPFSKNFIQKIDNNNKKIFILSPEGLIDIYL